MQNPVLACWPGSNCVAWCNIFTQQAFLTLPLSIALCLVQAGYSGGKQGLAGTLGELGQIDNVIGQIGSVSSLLWQLSQGHVPLLGVTD